MEFGEFKNAFLNFFEGTDTELWPEMKYKQTKWLPHPDLLNHCSNVFEKMIFGFYSPKNIYIQIFNNIEARTHHEKQKNKVDLVSHFVCYCLLFLKPNTN